MAETYATEAAGLGTSPISMASGNVVGGRLRRRRATITLASQASGDTIVLHRRKAQEVFAYGLMNSTVSLGTSTLKIGPRSSDAAFRAAAVFTTTDTPVLFGKAAAQSESAYSPTAAEEDVIATVGVAALPASGTLVIDTFYSQV